MRVNCCENTSATHRSMSEHIFIDFDKKPIILTKSDASIWLKKKIGLEYNNSSYVKIFCEIDTKDVF
jgi:hypothetical protein